MNTQLLTEAFNDCIDRLANGQTLEQCLRAYPDLADELRPLLLIGQASSRNRADAHEMSQMRSRLDAQIDTLLTETDFDSPPPFRLPQGVMVLIVSLIVVVIGGLLLLAGENNNVGGEDTETPTPEITQEATATETPEITSEVTVTETLTPNTPTPEISSTSNCELPDGWSEYRVRAGDTLSGIATNSGSSIEELTSINCLDDARFIVEGQTLFVPTLWQVNTQPQSNNGQSSNNSGSNNSGSSAQELDDDDDEEDDEDDDDDD